MAEVSAQLVAKLREKTGQRMMDCKKALVEAEGDVAGAEKLLKDWGMAGVEKRAGRATNEGCVFIKDGGNAIALVEIVCETDFVAKIADGCLEGANMRKTHPEMALQAQQQAATQQVAGPQQPAASAGGPA